MDIKTIMIIAVAAIVVGGAAAAVVLYDGGEDGGEDVMYNDASRIAASFSKDYTGFFGADFYLDEGATKAKAKAYYPNGNTSGYGSDNNFVTFHIFDDKAKAKDEFETNKIDYNAQIGKTAMGGTVKGTFEKAGLAETIGYYNNFSMGTPSTYLYFTGYKNNMFFESFISLRGTSIEGSAEIVNLVTAINHAVENPVPVNQAKIYIPPVAPPQPGVEYTGVAKKCNDFSAMAKMFGSASGDFAMADGSNAMSAKLQAGDGRYFVEMKIVPGGAEGAYNATAATLKAPGSPIMDTTVVGIAEKAGADNGIGCYFNSSMGGNVCEYVCYKGNLYAHVKLKSSGAVTDESAANLAKAVIAALTAS